MLMDRGHWAIARMAALLALGMSAGAGGVAFASVLRAYPVHGRVLAVPERGSVIAALDAVPELAPATTRRLHVTQAVRVGETFDAYLDVPAATLSDVAAADTFVAGLPNGSITHVVAKGDVAPTYRFETQTGAPFRFADLRGSVVLLSFVYTHCPDEDVCPAISGKFAYLAKRLDPQTYHLVEITLDPLHDSPPVLAAYGAHFGADPRMWSLLTGESAQIKNVIDAYGLDALETDPEKIIHGDTLAIIGRDGTVAQLIPTAGWAPEDVVASAQAAAGNVSNPLRRFELATVAGVIALCGGSVSTGIVVLDSVVFLLGVLILGGLLVWISKRVLIDERY